jgi:CBS domain containing-hemolysin-like protein
MFALLRGAVHKGRATHRCALTYVACACRVALFSLEGEHAKASGLTHEDGKLLKGALTFKDRSVGDIMTSLDSVYTLPEDTVLDEEALLGILTRGHSRVPITKAGAPDQIVALLFCKDLLGIGYERREKLSDIAASFHADERVVRVARSMRLNEAMEFCKVRRTHLVHVVDEPSPASGWTSGEVVDKAAPIIGVATMEDFIEELIQDEIVDEDDEWHCEHPWPWHAMHRSPACAPCRHGMATPSHKAHPRCGPCPRCVS